MPKAKWADISTDDIESAESSGRQPYEGSLPKAGVYRFRLIQAKQEKSQGGNDKLRTGWELDGSYKTEHEKYNGAPLWDHMPVMQSTAFRVKALCLALGVTSKDFYGATVTDEDGVVTKMGSRVFKDRDVFCYINVMVETDPDGQREDQLKLRGVGYLPKKDDDEDTSGASDPEPDTKPAAGKKPKKGAAAPEPEAKAGKTKKPKGKAKGNEDDDGEPPF